MRIPPKRGRCRSRRRIHAVERGFTSQKESTERWHGLTPTRFGSSLLAFSLAAWVSPSTSSGPPQRRGIELGRTGRSPDAKIPLRLAEAARQIPSAARGQFRHLATLVLPTFQCLSQEGMRVVELVSIVPRSGGGRTTVDKRNSLHGTIIGPVKRFGYCAVRHTSMRNPHGPVTLRCATRLTRPTSSSRPARPTDSPARAPAP